MRRWILALAILAIWPWLPSRGTELGQLHPVSLLVVHSLDREVVLSADTGATGTGETFAAALHNMEQTTPGKVFLDTTGQIVLVGDCTFLLPELSERLRSNVLVCRMEHEPEAAEASQFLQMHPPGVTLAQWNAGEQPPMLKVTEGRYLLEE